MTLQSRLVLYIYRTRKKIVQIICYATWKFPSIIVFIIILLWHYWLEEVLATAFAMAFFQFDISRRGRLFGFTGINYLKHLSILMTSVWNKSRFRDFKPISDFVAHVYRFSITGGPGQLRPDQNFFFEIVLFYWSQFISFAFL